jgi:hypothetical protein
MLFVRDAMINSAPDAGTILTKREFHQPQELDRRWFGPFDSWLKKLNTITSSNSVSRNFHWADTVSFLSLFFPACLPTYCALSTQFSIKKRCAVNYFECF